jgi:hypothetical protein
MLVTGHTCTFWHFSKSFWNRLNSFVPLTLWNLVLGGHQHTKMSL